MQASPLFELRCSSEEKRRGAEIWEDVRYAMIVDKHPASSKVSMVKLNAEDLGQDDIVPCIIGNFLRLGEISFGAERISKLFEDVKRAKITVWDLAVGPATEFGQINDCDITSQRGQEFMSELNSLKEILDEARIALVGAEIIAERLRDISKGDQKVGLDAALLGTPLKVMARQLGQVWLRSGYTLKGGQSGDGLDEVIVRVVEHVKDEKDRGSRRWLKDLMTDLRKELLPNVN